MLKVIRVKLTGKGITKGGDELTGVILTAKNVQEAVNKARERYQMEVREVYIWSERRKEYVLCHHSYWE